MKKVIIALVLSLPVVSLYSQLYDLVVMQNGDSIACTIDSINDTNLYLKINMNGQRINTFVKKSSVGSFEYQSIRKDLVWLRPGESIITRILTPEEREDMIGRFSHRYMYSPTAIPVKKADFYYNTFFFLIHDFQYGFSDHFSSRFGTSIFFMPYYTLPQFSFQMGEKSYIGLGDLFLFQPWDGMAMGNLAFGLYTYGSPGSNLSIGGGLWSTNESDIFDNGNKPAITLSGKYRWQDIELISENYFFQVLVTHLAQREPTIPIISENFSYLHSYVFGMAGLRFQKSKKPRMWEFGLLYIYTHQDKDIPDKYSDPTQWIVDARMYKVNSFLVLPIVSYTRKIMPKK